ncbi:type II toxin-antitoxin system RatA family toxin [Halapricum desulfuricans]|uniref:Polyketide cyclase/dehydrase family protein involved in binding/transport of lipids n=1 Tax=Halapricum desulfuricans TaxID=2841257 RepID=A0A897N9I7_9EURY|nr:SRPBCC family protein [Halapricum desulfuricans]QSG09134.1 Polyketide cyclase/dehydrase family protein involved in binding/transport of lipids [Halapricum desulfuricans]
MDTIEVSTVVYRSKADVYGFLVDFPRYASLSKYLRDVRQDGDGSAGTNYRLRFAWWKLSYTAHSTVTGLDPPDRIDWRLTKDLDARGAWVLESARPPDDRDAATRIRFLAHYDPHSAGKGTIDLPRFVSLNWVIEKARPLVRKEAERIVERLVTELEGESRQAELEIRTGTDHQGSGPLESS